MARHISSYEEDKIAELESYRKWMIDDLEDYFETTDSYEIDQSFVIGVQEQIKTFSEQIEKLHNRREFSCA